MSCFHFQLLFGCKLSWALIELLIIKGMCFAAIRVYSSTDGDCYNFCCIINVISSCVDGHMFMRAGSFLFFRKSHLLNHENSA